MVSRIGSRCTPSCYNPRLVRNIFIVPHIGQLVYRRYPLRFAKAQTQQVTGHICHRPYLLLLLQMAGIRRKDRSVAVSAVFPVWVGGIDALETQVFWGVEERERNECPGKWALTLCWKKLRGCWDVRNGLITTGERGLVLATHLLTYS